MELPVLPPTEDGVAEAARRLRAGGLVAVPTETVYGLAADARQPDAVARIFAAKGRPADHPLIVHMASIDALDEWAVDVPDWARTLGDACWPGPLTIVLPRREGVSDVVTGGRPTIGLRVPDHPVTLEVIRRAGAIAAPSANRFGAVSPTTAAHVVVDLRAYLLPDRDAVLDGGPCRVGVESTIVDATGDAPVLLRPGAVTAAEIEAITGLDVRRPVGGAVTAPGMHAAHYAPRAEVVVIDEGDEPIRQGRTGYFGSRATPDGFVAVEAPRPYVAELIAPVLYARLRQADELGLDRLVVERPPATGIGDAVVDRLLRAATGSRRA